MLTFSTFSTVLIVIVTPLQLLCYVMVYLTLTDMPNSIAEQTRQSLENIKNILEEAGTGMEKVVKTTVFLSDMGFFGEMNEVYQQYFKLPFPARSTVQVARLPKDALVEIEAIAYI